MPGISPLIFILLAVTFFLSYKGFKDANFFNQLKFNIRAIEEGNYYRLFTAGFIHVDQQHLFFNALTLFFFGDQLLYDLGMLNFLFLYFSSLLMGNIVAFYYHRRNPYYSAVGASGAIMGVLYSSILIFPDMHFYLLLFPIPIPAYIFGIGYLIYTLFGMRRQSDGIGHTAHLGGAAGGVLCTLIFDPFIFQKSFYTFAIIVIITLCSAVILYRRQ